MPYPFVIAAIESPEDRAWIQGIYDQYHPIMRQAARRFLPGADPDDAVQNATVALIRHIETLRSLDICKLRPYIVSTVRNVCYDLLRKTRRESGRTFGDPEDALARAQANEPDVDDRLIREAEIDELMKALRKLPEKELQLLEMKYFMQMPDSEIAPVLGIKDASVRYYLTLARRRLAGLLEENV